MMQSQRAGHRSAAQNLKASLAYGVVRSGVAALARTRQKRALRVLMYHGVLPHVQGPSAYGDLFITADAFARQMRYLKRAYQVLALEEVMQRIVSQGECPDRAVVITFDDGYRNTVTTALPILQALRLPATVFIAAQLAGTRDLLWFDAVRIMVAEGFVSGKTLELGAGIVIDGRSTDGPESVFADCVNRIIDLETEDYDRVVTQIAARSREGRFDERSPQFALAGWDEWREALADGGFAIGSHGLAHGNVAKRSFEGCLEEFQQSKRRLEEELARPCRAIAYPYGVWDHRVTEAARQAGYVWGLTTDDGLNVPQSDPLALHRTMVGDQGSFHLFCARVSGAWGWLRAMTATTSRRSPLPVVRGW